MAINLNTKSLSNLDTVTSVGENDNVLIESNGLMKRIDASLVGGSGFLVIDPAAYNDNSNVDL